MRTMVSILDKSLDTLDDDPYSRGITDPTTPIRKDQAANVRLPPLLSADEHRGPGARATAAQWPRCPARLPAPDRASDRAQRRAPLAMVHDVIATCPVCA